MKPLTKPRLAIILSKLPSFESAIEGLEQYPTDSEIAAGVLWSANMLEDIQGKEIVDLGCGGGVLGLGALLLGADKVTMVDIDPKALDQAKTNLSKLKSEGLLGDEGADILAKDRDEESREDGEGETGRVTWVQGNVAEYKGEAEVAIMNPPFGTRMKHHDRIFLEKAMEIAPLIYSFHKSETLPYLRDYSRRNGFEITHEWRFSFPLKATMSHHRRRIHHIEVCCIRLVKQ